MKKTRKKKQVCGAACFMAAEIKFSEDVRPLQYHIKSLQYHIKTLQYKSLLRSQIYHGSIKSSFVKGAGAHDGTHMDMKNYIRTQITLYEEDKKEEASMRCSLLNGS